MNKFGAKLDRQLALRRGDGINPSSHTIPGLEEQNLEAGFRQHPRCGETGDSCAHYDHVLHCTSQLRVSARGPCAGTGCLSAWIDKAHPGRRVAGVKRSLLPSIDIV